MAIGQLTVSVVANTARARKNLKSFRGDVSATSKTVEMGARSFRRLAGGLSAVAATYVSFRAFNQIAADLDRTAKVADKLGVATDRLMGLRHAAEQTAGVVGGTLDMALQRMTRRVSEAARGKGEAVGALEELNLNAEELNRLSPDKIFYRVADAMQKVEGQGDRVRLAFKLFDSEGVDLVNTLKGGASALRDFQRESERLNGDLSREKLARVEAYNDAMDRLKKAVGGAGSSIVIEAAPTLTEAADAMTEAVQGFKSFRLPKNHLTDRVRDTAKGGHDLLARGYYNAFFKGDNSSGALSASEQAAAQQRVEAAKQQAARASQPVDIYQRAAHARIQKEENRREAMDRWSKTFDKSTAGLKKWVGEAASGVQSFRQQLDQAKRRGLANAAQGLNPLTGRAPIGKSEARRQLEEEQRRGGVLRPAGDRLNRLVDANSREGYMALHANRRSARDNPAAKAATKTAENTKRSAVLQQQSLDALRLMGRYFQNAKPPASA